jgi:hypothetical protein
MIVERGLFGKRKEIRERKDQEVRERRSDQRVLHVYLDPRQEEC